MSEPGVTTSVVYPREGVAVVEIHGEHDLTTKQDTDLLLDQLLSDCELLVLDVSSAEFIDSSVPSHAAQGRSPSEKFRQAGPAAGRHGTDREAGAGDQWRANDSRPCPRSRGGDSVRIVWNTSDAGHIECELYVLSAHEDPLV